MESKIKIVLVDLDLTLLHSDETLSKRNVDALKKCQEKGILVGFCTSRGKASIKQYADIVNPEIWICNAGACIYFHEELIHSEVFTQEEAQALFNKTYQICGSDIEITADTENDIHWNKTQHNGNSYLMKAKYNDFKDFGQPVFKFCVQTDSPEKALAITKDFPNCSAIAFSDIPWYTFSPKTATKENGVLFLEKHLGIPASQMISFGDDFADIGMLKTTGIGVAMANAIDEVKQIATAQTCSCDEDGVADYLEKFVL
ncbi:MAG: HAD family hydrolase [Treponema sp.]|nr:HAD family hydrolase [Treponema sp.]